MESPLELRAAPPASQVASKRQDGQVLAPVVSERLVDLPPLASWPLVAEPRGLAEP